MRGPRRPGYATGAVPAYGATRGSATSPCRRSGRRPDSPTIGPGTAAPPTTPAWCCWSRSAGVRILLTGDVEPRGAGGAGPAPAGPAGRRAQGAAPRQPLPGPATSCVALGARVALVSVGRGQRLRAPGAARRWSRSRSRDAGAAHRPGRRPSRSSPGGRLGAGHRAVSPGRRGCRRAVAGCATMAGPRASRRPGPGHAGDRPGGVPRRAHRRGGPRTRSGATTRRPSSPRPARPT